MIFPACSTVAWANSFHVAFGINTVNHLYLLVLDGESLQARVFALLSSREIAWIHGFSEFFTAISGIIS